MLRVASHCIPSVKETYSEMITQVPKHRDESQIYPYPQYSSEADFTKHIEPHFKTPS